MLEFKDVYYCPNDIEILKKINLKINDGEIFVVMGPSGSGKSTILRLLNGLIRPSSGQVLVENENIALLPEKKLVSIRKKVGMVFQFAALFDSLTVAENVGFAWRKLDINKQEFEQRVAKTLKEVDLENIGEMMPSELSGGMKKRVGLARAIAMNPEVLLYDEPTAGLDPISSKTIVDLIKDLRKRLHLTSVVVTHDLACAFEIADRIALLHDKQVIFSGTVDEMKNSSIPRVKQFINSSYFFDNTNSKEIV